jgi:pimeloyl-ACP methyl ester carboxylesterase
MKRILLSCVFILYAAVFSAQVQPLDAELKNVQYPFPVSFIHFTIQGENVQMAYMDVKPGKANGKVIMLLHGKNFNGAYWEQTANDLAKIGYRVIIPDQVGFGKSSKPQHIQYSFHLLAQSTKMMLDTLGITKVSVLGHSMGGMVASRFVLMYPGMIDKFVLENPIGLEDYKVKVPYRPVEELYKGELQNSYEKIKSYQLANYYDNRWKPGYDKWVNMLAGWTVGPDKEKVAWNAALTTDMIMTQPIVYELENISVPTLLIIGQRDRTALGKDVVSEEVKKTMGYYPDLGKQTAKKIKNSKLVELENVGHLPHIEAYDKFIKALADFLEE